MAVRRYVSLIDIPVLAVVAVAIFLPPREMYAQNVIKGDDFGVALAEARTMASPGDGKAIEDFTRKLGDAGLKDWAIETSVRLSDRAKDSPTRWRALIAASVAYVEKLDVVPALDYANRALAACEATRERGDAAACPSWEEIRMRLYQQNLDAGVKSGIDPHVDPAGFRRAGESALRQIRLGPARPAPPSAPQGNAAPGSGAGSAQ
ncbi:MAG TPA: hypothetical protein VFS15_11120 [Kofleriaceae bacterium]|nr:hypothetical protein [Kofleriaceae bacterium]